MDVKMDEICFVWVVFYHNKNQNPLKDSDCLFLYYIRLTEKLKVSLSQQKRATRNSRRPFSISKNILNTRYQIRDTRRRRGSPKAAKLIQIVIIILHENIEFFRFSNCFFGMVPCSRDENLVILANIFKGAFFAVVFNRRGF